MSLPRATINTKNKRELKFPISRGTWNFNTNQYMHHIVLVNVYTISFNSLSLKKYILELPAIYVYRGELQSNFKPTTSIHLLSGLPYMAFIQ